MYELLSVDPNELTTVDADMWYKVNNYERGLVTPVDLQEYRTDVKNSNNSSRLQFQGLIFNKISPIWSYETQEKIKKDKTKP
ncbi:MAG: hypothetical protein UT09_C0002G0023 [Parcubacteria group bacterium GW2011_GWF2_38_8]|nr:MAG: hypothetical protein UT09_C0002G0023 [Parcubacteria group bacterium GW2011_GWF2_38_8]